MANVHANLFGASFASDRPIQGGGKVTVLPLNLLALIISHLENVADLAQVCQTCRVLYYMTLPQLYNELTLTSHDTIRYRDKRPEGCGSASPFSMGLNAVVTRNVANLVHSLRLRGEWKEYTLAEHSRVGRVPDDTMMLNIAVRAAVDRMSALEKFSWELNTKMLETVYLGLAARPKLASLTIRFPSTRYPRPITVIPPFPRLRALKITDIDPLCYPDDISTVLAESKKLEELKLHWSPRIREAREPSISLNDLFRKNIAAKRPLKLKTISIQNMFAQYTPDFDYAIDNANVENVSIINCVGEDEEEGSELSFFDQSWKPSKDQFSKLRSIRHDRLNRDSAEHLGQCRGIERMYLINSRAKRHTLNGAADPSPVSASSAGPSPIDQQTPSSGSNITTILPTPGTAFQLQNLYLEAIFSKHGQTLKHLLLPARWPLNADIIAQLVRACPNLTQLGVALEFSALDAVRLLLPFLRKLRALRVLVPTVRDLKARERSLAEIVEADDEIHEEKLGDAMGKEQFGELRWVGIGWKVWEVGGTFEFEDVDEDGNKYMRKRRRVRRVPLEMCQHVEIWGLDSDVM